MKYSFHEYECWEVLYTEQRLSCQQIALNRRVPVSTIKKHLKKRNLLRTIDASRKGRIPWNKGKKTGQIPWNKNMKGRYPYPSPFLNKKSPQKGVSRSSQIKNKISLTHRLNRWTGCRIYSSHLLRQDSLYFCVLHSENQFFFKIGRTFYTVRSRCGKHLVQVIGVWKSTHERIVAIEKQALLTFQEYEYIPSKKVSGRTECFSSSLPWLKVFQFIDTAISSQAISTEIEGSETTGEV